MQLKGTRLFIVILLMVSATIVHGRNISFHPFYVSVTEMNYNASAKSLEISCKMFVDDMEDVLKKQFNMFVDLSNQQQETANKQMLKAYLLRHLSLNIDGRQANLQFIGFEKDKESVYCYLEVTNLAAIKKIQATNSILHDFKREQINIIHASANGNRKSTKLNFPNRVAELVF